MSTLNLFRFESDLVAIKEGDKIFSEGDSGDVMYIVREGLVELKVGGTILARLGPNEFFGEMALVDDKPRSATATVVSDCKVLPVDKKRFMFMVQETPFFAIDVMQTMSERLRRMNERQQV